FACFFLTGCQGFLVTFIFTLYRRIPDSLVGVLHGINTRNFTLKYLSDLWSRFWDAAMNIGREDSLDEQIAALQEKVSRAKRL
ncbi:hypothetical protein, partial [Escherichia coli]|uniref:hypothetical protein n=1 Tax=Escherichia coli TaxID=562 RepID=UPI003EDF90CF